MSGFLDRIGPASRVTLGVVTLTALVAAALGYWNVQSARERYLEAQARLIHNHLQRNKILFESAVTELRRQVLILAQVPPVQAIIGASRHSGVDPASGDSMAVWGQRLEQVFAATCSAIPACTQVRYIGVHDGGRELVRVDLIDGRPIVAPPESLQPKGGHDYFRETLGLPAGEVYVSRIGLNREHGEVQVPHVRTLRAATPIYAPDDSPFGIVVINLDVGPAIDAIVTGLPAGVRAYLTNAAGDYLAHPEPARAFAFDLGRRAALQQDLGDTLPFLADPQPHEATLRAAVYRGQAVRLAAVRIELNPRQPEHFLWLIYDLPEAAIDAEIAGLGLASLAAGGGLIAVVAAVAYLLLRMAFTPLTRITALAQAIGAGRYDVALPEHAPGEIGELARALASMRERIATRERENAQVDEALRGDAAHLRTVVENLGEGIAVSDLDGRVLSFNRAAIKMHGFSNPREYLRKLPEFVDTFELSTLDGAVLPLEEWPLSRILAGETLRDLELDIRRRGTDWQRIFSYGGALARDEEGRALLAIVTIRDVTQRKQGELKARAQRALAERHEALMLTVARDRCQIEVLQILNRHGELAPALTEVLNLIGEKLELRPAGVYLHDEWQGALVLIAASGLPETCPRTFDPGQGPVGQAAEDRVAARVSGEQAGLALGVDPAAGSIDVAELIAAPLVDRDQALGALAVASAGPISADKRHFVDWLAIQLGLAVRDRRQYQQMVEMTRQLERRGQRIERQNAELELLDRIKSEFLANMSHELRTPLNAIIGFSELMRDGLAGEVNEQQADYLAEVLRSGRHLLALINDILDLSKVESGKLELELESLDGREVFDGALSIVREAATKAGITLACEIGEAVGEFLADGVRLRQILYNLLSNAVKFTPEGGRVTLTAQRRSIDDEDTLEFDVADTGIGISKADQKRLFEPFEQLDGSISRQYGGTGLGLALVKNLVRLHGGEVEVESAPGRGSRFTVRLPYRDARRSGDRDPEKGPRTRSKPVRPMAGGTPWVLLIEDDAPAAALMTDHLESSGFAVKRAACAEEALGLIDGWSPDLIVLDLLSPGIDGMELLNTVKGDPRTAQIPVIIVSIVGDESRRRGLSLGAIDVFQKPVSMPAVLRSMERIGILPSVAKRVKVLVVDDDPRAVRVVSRALEKRGFSVVPAFGGREALAAARRERPDLIVLDLLMPDISGFEVIERLQRDPDLADTPTIVLTAKKLDAAERRKFKNFELQVMRKHGFDHDTLVAEARRLVASAPVRATAVAADGGGADSEARGATILVVEDKEVDRALLSGHLRQAGFTVCEARDGEEALALLDRMRPDLIVLDLMMPNMDGIAFLEAKARHRVGADIPVVVSAADASEPRASLRVDAYLSKPVRRRTLLKVIRGLRISGERMTPRLLVVDDDPAAIKLLTSYLADEPLEVEIAFSGQEALEVIRSRPPDLVILDLIMPDLNGWAVLARMRRLPGAARIPVIVVTSKLLGTRERRSLLQTVEKIISRGDLGDEKLTQQIQVVLDQHRGR